MNSFICLPQPDDDILIFKYIKFEEDRHYFCRIRIRDDSTNSLRADWIFYVTDEWDQTMDDWQCDRYFKIPHDLTLDDEVKNKMKKVGFNRFFELENILKTESFSPLENTIFDEEVVYVPDNSATWY